MRYLDTSPIVAAFSVEPTSGRAREWPGERDAGQSAISDRTVTELSSAVATNSLTVPGVTAGHFRAAARFADGHAPGVRAGDAPHPACVSAHGAIAWTLDQQMAEAGSALGVVTELRK